MPRNYKECLTKSKQNKAPPGQGFLAWVKWLRRPLFTLFFARLCLAAQRPAFVWSGVGNQPVGLAPFVILWKVLGNRKPFFVHKQEAVAIFVDLHIFACADRGRVFDLFVFVRKKAAGAQSFPQLLIVNRQSLNDGFSYFVVGMGRGAGLFAVFLNKLAHALESFRAGFLAAHG